jgi:Ca2+-dependent lipid-binding protein
MCLNKALFTDNGHCGFVLKPEILRNPLLDFNPEDVKSMKTRKNVEIKIISALNLPQNDEILIKDISDPFVIVNIFGIKLDLAEKKTKSVQDNGFNPIWNETFKFVVNCPELAFVKFTVKDEDIGKDQFIGDFTIRFNNMRPGCI